MAEVRTGMVALRATHGPKGTGMTPPADGHAKCHILGVGIGTGSLADITAMSLQAIASRGPTVTFACANPHSLVTAQQDDDFRGALNATTLVVADGVGVILAGTALRLGIGPRITGEAYFQAVLDALRKRGSGRVFFFGSSPEVLALISARFAREYPGLTLCGTLSPPFGTWSDTENQRMVDAINAARPDVLWVGMTAPKQEKWVHANVAGLQVPVIGSIGAVFDFYAGSNPRAPAWMRNLGLEWLYRLLREPSRMWRRTFVSAPRFISLVLASQFRSRG